MSHVFGRALAEFISLSAAVSFGVLLGRAGEFRRLLSPVTHEARERRVGDFEDVLRRTAGARRLHPDPANASHVRQLRFRR